MEQLVRDARIAQIYEGANGIQALDLVGRKLGQNMGRLLRRFFHPVGAYVEAGMAKPELAEFVAPLAKSLSRLQQSTLWIAQQGLKDRSEEHTSELQSLKRISYAVVCMKKNKQRQTKQSTE